MKLYTEEQVRWIYEKGVYDGSIGLEHDIENNICYYEPIELPNYKEQLDRIEELLLSQKAAQRNKFKIGPL